VAQPPEGENSFSNSTTEKKGNSSSTELKKNSAFFGRSLKGEFLEIN
jgi:hypothetical protein